MDQPFESDVMEDLATESSEFIEELFDDFDGIDGADYTDDNADDAFSPRPDAFAEASDLWEEETGSDSLETNSFEDEFSSEFASDYAESYAEGEVADHYDDSSYKQDSYDAQNFDGQGFDSQGFDDQSFDSPSVNRIDSAIADALGADNTDEFIRRLRQVANIARQVGRGVGQAARAVAPIASAIPLPQAQAIGRIASTVGRLLFDGADEFEALDAALEMAEHEDAIDAALPVIAGLTIRSIVPRIAQTPRPVRQQLVRSVSQSARLLARQQGPQAVRAIAPVVRSVQRTAQQRRLPVGQLPRAVQQTARRVAADPRLTRRLAQRPISPMGGAWRSPRTSRTAGIRTGPEVRVGTFGRTAISTEIGMGSSMPRRLILQGPVEILIRSR